MKIKGVATKKGSGVFICYCTTLITLNIKSEYGNICKMSANRGQLASKNVSRRRQGKDSVSWTKKLGWRYNFTGLLPMLHATALLKETLCILFGRAKLLKVGHY
jgi:hypothetical protein